MLQIKYLLMTIGLATFGVSAAVAIHNIYQVFEYRRRNAGLPPDVPAPPHPEERWGLVRRLAIVSLAIITISMCIEVVPSGYAGIRVSQISGTRPGTLYAGVHFVKPLVESIAIYDLRDQVLSTASTAEQGKSDLVKKEIGENKPEVFTVQSREGLNIGLAITVRYKLDPKRLEFIHNNVPQPVERELVPPVVASTFREVIPSYTVRDVFASKREEVRKVAAEQITSKLAADGIIVKEVMLRDIHLPEEYSRGMEGLLLKEQENEGLGVEQEIKQKEVRIAEFEADAAKVREVKHAEGDAQVRVLQAKSEADAMTYTLPLKQKQIEQTRLESEARKESTVKNAEAQAQAKVIDSKAEMERRDLLATSEAKRIRIVAEADTERMKQEAVLLKQNPLLINKIVAERLSDKLQIMMVPSDGRFFFNDVLKGSTPAGMAAQAEQTEEGAEEAVPATTANIYRRKH
jgi:regulator of protease activity HflC (stomatin/prohibitin superfamily)